jgi:hypothetical protein
MEIILYSPNFHFYLNEAALMVQFLIDGFIGITGQFKL